MVQGLMNLAEIQSFKKIGTRLRHTREARGLALPALARSCGMTISELVRIENGELLGFTQGLVDTLKKAELYAHALEVGLEHSRCDQDTEATIRGAMDTDYIPIFLRKKSL